MIPAFLSSPPFVSQHRGMPGREKFGLCSRKATDVCLFFLWFLSNVCAEGSRRGSLPSSPKPHGLRVAASCEAEIRGSVYGSGCVCAEAVLCQETAHKHRQSVLCFGVFFWLVPERRSSGGEGRRRQQLLPPSLPRLRTASTRRRQGWKSGLSWSCWNLFFFSSVSSSGRDGHHLLPPPQLPSWFPSPVLQHSSRLIYGPQEKYHGTPSNAAVILQRYPPKNTKQPLICSPSAFSGSARLAVLAQSRLLRKLLTGTRTGGEFN